MTDKQQADLKQQVALLRAAVSELEDARAQDTTADELAALNIKVERMAADINAQLAEIRRVLLGDPDNDERGAMVVLDSLVKTAEGLGRIYEDVHREAKLKGEVIESLLPRIEFEKFWRESALWFQARAIRLQLEVDNLHS